MNKPILYGIAASRASRNIWMLEELGVAYDRVLQSYKNKATHTPDYLAINPNGHIPTWVDEEGVMWESLAINLYLSKKYPSALSAQSIQEEGQCLKWSFWAVSEIEKDALTVLMHMVAMPVEQRKPELVQQAIGALRKPLSILNAHLSKHDYMLGQRFTVLDINLAALCAWLRPSKVLLDENPHLFAWLSKCLDRSAFKAVQAFAKQDNA